MSQASLTIADGNGEEVLTRISNALQALGTNYYGATDPATNNITVPLMIWADSGNSLVKQRNAANTAWIPKGILLADGTIQWHEPLALPLTGGSLTGALHQSNPVTLATVNGVLTLTEDSNSFSVPGTEPVTSITGWTSGTVQIRWTAARTITHNDTSLILQGKTNRAVAVGDISEFEMTAAGAREKDYFPATVQSNISFPLGTGNYIVSGRKVSGVNGFQVNVAAGQHVINNMPVSIAANAVTIPARSAALIYDKADGTTDKVLAQLPYSYIDNNTVGFWDFTNWDGASAISNSAVGYNGNTIAAANNLTKLGTITKVDGWVGYGAQLDGTSGYFSSANFTNFPSGASKREVSVLFTLNKSTVSGGAQVIFEYGGNTTSTGFGLYLDASNNFIWCGMSNDNSTGYIAEVGKTYLVTIQYDGTYGYVYINGQLVLTTPSKALATALTYPLYVGAQIGTVTWYCGMTVHYVDLRNALRTSQQIAQIANTLLLPNFYTKPSAVYPTVLSSDLSAYHEWRFAETSGNTIADSNTVSSLTAAAAGTTIVNSPLGLGNARSFNGSSDYINLGALNQGTEITIIEVVKPNSYAVGGLFENRLSTKLDGIALNINTDGTVTFYNGPSVSGAAIASKSILSLGNPNFIAFTGGNGNAALYVNSAIPDNSASGLIGTLIPSTHAAYVGQLKTESNTWGYALNATIDYLIIIPRALSQGEIAQYYNALMKTGRRSIVTDIVPTNGNEVAFVRSNSSGVTSYNDSDYGYGRREKAYDGNRRVFLGYRYFSAGTALTIDNIFKTDNISISEIWFKKYITDIKHSIVDVIYSTTGGTYFGTFVKEVSPLRIVLNSYNGNVIDSGNSYTGNNESAGFIGLWAKVLEDD